MTISRRRCLAVAAAALAAGPAVAEKVLEVGNAVEQHGVVIVGSGLAGLSAAAGALENGADSVLILEKGPLVGGHSQRLLRFCLKPCSRLKVGKTASSSSLRMLWLSAKV